MGLKKEEILELDIKKPYKRHIVDTFSWESSDNKYKQKGVTNKELDMAITGLTQITKQRHGKLFEPYLVGAYIFYKWNLKDTWDNIDLDDGKDTIHTFVMFYKDRVVLQKTACEIYNYEKHMLQLSYEEFFKMLEERKKVEGDLYDWEYGEY